MKKKISYWKRLMFFWFNKCPNCGAKITTCWYSFANMKMKYKCVNCGNEYI